MPQQEQPKATPSPTPLLDKPLVVRVVPTCQVKLHWEYIADQISKALTWDGTQLEDIHAQLLDGNMQLWMNKDLVVVTQINFYGKKKYLCYVVVSGKNFFIHRWQDTIKEWAIDQGCIGDELYGRMGWMRKLKDFTPTKILMRREYGK